LLTNPASIGLLFCPVTLTLTDNSPLPGFSSAVHHVGKLVIMLVLVLVK